MGNNSDIKCCKCGKVNATVVNGEVQFRGVDVDWVRITEIRKTGKTTKYKCRGCYSINTLTDDNKTEIDQKAVGMDLLNNFKRK